MKLYIAIVQGVYRHEIIGVYNDKEKANKSAITWLDQETDDYHEVIISTVELNVDCCDCTEIIKFTQRGKKTKFENGKHILIEKGVITKKEIM